MSQLTRVLSISVGRDRLSRLLAFGCSSLLVLFGRDALAQAPQPQGGEIPVNAYTTQDQSLAAVGAAGDGSFVVVWMDTALPATASQDGSGAGVYGRRFSASGVAQSPVDFQVNVFEANSQFEPAVAVAQAGQFVVSWTSEYQTDSSFGLDVWARLYNASGGAQTGEFRVNTQTNSIQRSSSLAVDSSGNFVVVWMSRFQDGSGEGIYGQRFNNAGIRQGTTEFPVNTTTLFDQVDPAVAMDADGDFVVVWASNSQDGSGDGIYARRYNSSGQAAPEGELPINQATLGNQILPAVAMDAAGNFVVAWENLSSAGDGSGSSIYARLFNSNGVALTNEFLVNTTTTTNHQSHPSVAAQPTGGFVITWDSIVTATDQEVYARRYSTAGTPLGSEVLVNTTLPGAQQFPAIAVSTGQAVIAWHARQDGAEFGIVARRLTLPGPQPAGTLQFSEATPSVDEAAGSKVITVLRTGGATGAVTVDYTVTPGTATPVSDFTPTNGTLTFADGESSKTFTITILDDSVQDAGETVALALSNPTGGATLGAPTTATLTITDTDGPIPNPTGPFYLAEGATGFFTLEFAIANPNAVAAPITASFLKSDGSTVTLDTTLLPTSRSTIDVNQIPGLEAEALSTVIQSLNTLPLVVERTMSWDRQRVYAGHTEKAGEGARRQWFFAEGSQGFFDTYVLLANPQPAANTATVTFLREGLSPVTKIYPLLPSSRVTVYAGDIPELVNQSFGITVTFAEPGAAERSMYFGTTPTRQWSGGHGSVGVAAPATSWFHAEGATGDYFDTYILVANPNPTAATVSYRYLLTTGEVVTINKFVPGNSRLTVNVEVEHPLLANAAVSTQVTSDLPIVSERAMYWFGPSATWVEAHNSFGLTAIGTKWGLAEGSVGIPPFDYETYILLANPNDTATMVTITYLRTNGSTVAKTYPVPPTSRFNVFVNADVPELSNEDFSAVIEATLPIAVERALYWNAEGIKWAAGTNATAARLP